MYTEFDGDSASVVDPTGIDHILDAGLNWYINKNKFKIAAHYLFQGGRPKSNYSAGPDAKGNVTVRGNMAAINFQVQF
jgi:phosphate-selective porin